MNKPVTILIAEDNEVNMMLVTSILENILPNATLIEAENGAVAIEKAMEKKPDLIFMDVRMPEKNGYEASMEIRKLQSERVPIIALTAGTAIGEREKCLAAGMDDYVSKPIVLDSILKVIRKWLYKETFTAEGVESIDLNVDNKVHFDKAELSNMLENRAQVIKKFLELSKASLGKCLPDLHQQLKDHDFLAITETAHKLKGLALSACFNKLASLSSQLEETDIQHQKEIAELINEIDREAQLVRSLIE